MPRHHSGTPAETRRPRALMIALGDMGSLAMMGVRRKLHAQRRALAALMNCPVDIVEQHGGQLAVTRDGHDEVLHRLRRGIDNYRISVASAIKEQVATDDYRLVYIRFPGFCDPSFLRILGLFRSSAIVMEVPTYPLKDERAAIVRDLIRSRRLVRLSQFVAQVLVDRLTRWRMRVSIDRLLCIGDPPDVLWGMKTIRITNGCDTNLEQLSACVSRPDRLVMICVAGLHDYHGLDRVIRGMAVYRTRNSAPSLHLDIIGSGPAVPDLRKMAEEYNLNDSVTFHGFRSGSELRELYQNSDIGIASLGLHRIGITSASVLKGLEYCALGLPFVYSYRDDRFSDDLPFCLRLPASDDPVDMDQVVAFWRSLHSLEDVRSITRAYAEQRLGWNCVLAPVLEGLGLMKLTSEPIAFHPFTKHNPASSCHVGADLSEPS